ncbi:MAG: rhodanese-like domain-containing protein [Dissulfurimicrobium sp.]|uniref:rhodanese-like domain-containing protein n=1 Tax=Dissulfurimicrobium sp. TaxID=2022436 RepID=UPI0040491513
MPKERYRVTPEQLATDIKHGKRYAMLDVRKQDEFDRSHLQGTINIPFRGFMKHLDLLPEEKDAPILLICQTEHRANYVIGVLRELGYSQVYTLKEGYGAYLRWFKVLGKGGDKSFAPVPVNSDQHPISPHEMDEA